MTDLQAHRRHRSRRSGEFTLPGAEKHYPPDLSLEPTHLAIDLHLGLGEERCAGTVTTTVRARVNGASRLELDAVAFEDLAVADADGQALEWTYDGRRIVVEWRSPLAAGEERRLAVTYRVTRPASGLYFSKPSAAYPDAAWFAATDHETERARHWLPCVDHPNVRPRLDFRLRAEERFTILANGALVDEQSHGDGTKTAHWRLDFPCPSYLTCFAIGDFTRADDGEARGIPLAYFGPSSASADDLRRSFGRTGEMLAWLERKLDMPLPFPKYYQVALPGVGGAMENISLVMWDDVFVLDETLAAEWTRLLDEINVHEMAHSYFGDAVVCREYAHAWLKESWATYMEQVWFEETQGPDEQQLQYYRDAQGYFREADEAYKRPLVTREFNSSWDLYDAHLYPGGACRLHTLRCEVGDGPFWSAVREYLRRYAGRVVETEDFRRLLEEHSGKSLVRQFDQWFYTAGYPAIKVSFRYDPKRREGTFEVEQTQAKPSGKDGEEKGPGAFHLRTDVGWVIEGRSATYAVELTQPRHVFIVPMERDPEQVRFDPFHKVLHKLDFNPGDEKLRAQLTGAPDVIGRILAGRELAKTRSRANIRAVADAYRDEPFWGVRVWWAQALGEAGTGEALEALVELVAWERDPMVLEAVVRAAGTYRDERIAAAIEARLDAGLPYYRATAAAYEALGAQREGAPFDRLLDAAGRDGYGGHAQSGALRALGATRREEAVGALLDRAAYGATSNRARPAAVVALGALGRLQERAVRQRIVEALVDLLRDPVHRVRDAAVTALQVAGATEAIGALEAVRAPLSVQEQVRVDRAIHAIRGADKPKAAAAEKQMDELREQIRSLRATVEKLEAGYKRLSDGARDEESAEGKKAKKGKEAKKKKGGE